MQGAHPRKDEKCHRARAEHGETPGGRARGVWPTGRALQAGLRLSVRQRTKGICNLRSYEIDVRKGAPVNAYDRGTPAHVAVCASEHTWRHLAMTIAISGMLTNDFQGRRRGGR